ncbi:hypothetical protein EDB81DRAFT_862843 [Dactylonectria macrodidyma]|uniref:Uncharacterized protein n=1 Tax=Dactylonectria macrodidyma TaxID=307937 RepID=A0A9P9D2M7_9HYPO|nr:hypothetical protein EDB81DRAFT_862843 [Dactylonectria macrodidyma]
MPAADFSLLHNSFSTFLSSPRREGQRHPYGFLKALRATREAADTDTSSIFLKQGGLRAWAAHFVVHPGTANANGHQALRQQFAALDKLSAEHRASFARSLASLPIDPTVERLILSMESMAGPAEPPTAVTVPSKRRRTENPPGSHETLPSPPYPNDYTPDGQGYHDASQTNTDSTLPKQEVTSGADVEGLDLFHEYLRGAIRRDDAGDRKTAAVSMNFPPNTIADVDCALTMEVLPNKVERLASLLFDAHLETNGKVREMILEGGRTAIVSRLQGSPPELVSKVFGPVTAAAIEAAPFRRLEVSEGTVATRCVSMSDFTESDKGAIITLTLGYKEASQIYEKLFKSKSHSRYAVYFSVHPDEADVARTYLLPEPLFNSPPSQIHLKSKAHGSLKASQSCFSRDLRHPPK